MARYWIIALILALLTGCGDRANHMDHPEDPQGRYRDQIAAAQHVLDQKEDWGDRAEWEVVKTRDGWEVTAWRIEHPERKGPSRYVPWGYSVIELDSRDIAINYHRGG